MIPTARFLGAALLGVLPLAAAYRFPTAGYVTLAWDLLLVLALGIDFVACPCPETVFIATRQRDDALALGSEAQVRLQVRNRTDRRHQATVRDEPPGAFGLIGSRQQTATFAPGETREIVYQIAPPARGDYAFGDIYLRLVGPLGLAQRPGRLPAAGTVAVLPDIRKARIYAVTAQRAQRARPGAHRTRLVGDGREFASLREYLPDDPFRAIDWKATARRGKVIARTFEAERSQDILILIDQGRLMHQRLGYVEKIDSVIDAALALGSAVAVADDRVGLLTFDAVPRTWLTPRRGRVQVEAMLQSLYATHAQAVESDYRAAFRALSARWRKRSLVVLFTDISDPESSAVLLSEIVHLTRNHLVLCATVRDPLLAARARQYPGRPEHPYEIAVATQTLEGRAHALALLAKNGVLVVDAEPEQLSADLVAGYLAVKRRALL